MEYIKRTSVSTLANYKRDPALAMGGQWWAAMALRSCDVRPATLLAISDQMTSSAARSGRSVPVLQP